MTVGQTKSDAATWKFSTKLIQLEQIDGLVLEFSNSIAQWSYCCNNGVTTVLRKAILIILH